MSGDAIDTILAFDFGLKRIGVAIGNTMICQAKPLSVITATANEPKFAAIDSLIKEWGASRIVVGLPSHPDGTEHEMSARCRRFANQVHGRFNLPVELVDERYSSAVIAAKRGEVIDDRAAAVILQQYFDANY
ncbi:Holliday junction resolvase RuvX [Janthinobacterium sp. 13]|uniref:Holliday junction resolvase RuvX n=1 Tax=Janthinobacterium sp. 13 TaxID=2035211 RepID=UPI000C62D732|nr:Holliday junction resolvase RuvX [Janthinobacterium sp. 13]PIF11466.1 putative Holliday junction resolvase [Janthinobacterium sp. 13]